jgi:hypothetical protein
VHPDDEEEGRKDRHPAKRLRVDPASVHADEMKHRLFSCSYCSSELPTTADGFMVQRDGGAFDLACKLCQEAVSVNGFCSHCGALRERTPDPYRNLWFGPVYNKDKEGRCPDCTVPTVVRLKRTAGQVVQDCDTYIGRACTQGGWLLSQTVWANPYKVGRDGTLEEVLARYEAWLRGKPDLMARLPELAGKRLGCWCKPKPCHGDVLARLVEQEVIAKRKKV